MLDEEKAMMVSETIDGLKDEDMKTTQEQVRKLNRPPERDQGDAAAGAAPAQHPHRHQRNTPTPAWC